MNAGMHGSELAALGKEESIQDAVLLDTDDKQAVATFRNLFKIIEEPDIVTHCMCSGWPTFEFYSGSHLIARFSMHHGDSIRWVRWDSDADLKENIAVLNWLDANGRFLNPRSHMKKIKPVLLRTGENTRNG